MKKKVFLLIAAVFLLGVNYLKVEPGFTPAEESIVPIGELYQLTADFEGKSVRIKGTVVAPLKFMRWNGFILRDSTGTIWVTPHSRNTILPQVGTEIEVKGRITQVITVSFYQLLELVEE